MKTQNDDRQSKGYDDMKEFICTCCGRPVMLTKFASAKTAKCKECKDNKLPQNQDILDKILAEKSSKAKPTNVVDGGNTKIVQCTMCGKDMEVNKFASASKAVCDECTGVTVDQNGNMEIKIDMSKLNRDIIPTIEEYNLMPSVISNPRLRDVKCPACGTEPMKILNILDYSDRGLVIHYQCTNCLLLTSVSEQCDFLCKTRKQGHQYDYSGNDIEDLMTCLQSTRINGSMRKLIDIIREHNIQIDGIELPPYTRVEDKPVPIGFTIPTEDKWVKFVSDLIHAFNTAECDGDDIDVPEGSRYIRISDTLKTEIVDKLKGLLEVTMMEDADSNVG